MKVSTHDSSATSRILVIDDDRGIRELLCDLLESDERSVDGADTGEAGVGMFRQQGADLSNVLVVPSIIDTDKEQPPTRRRIALKVCCVLDRKRQRGRDGEGLGLRPGEGA